MVQLHHESKDRVFRRRLEELELRYYISCVRTFRVEMVCRMVTATCAIAATLKWVLM
jgi:hypothetical protein